MSKFISIAIAGTVSTLSLSACFNPGMGECRVHCWEDRPEIEDLNSDVEFDSTCTNFHTTPSAFEPPLPPVGFFVGKACAGSQNEHALIKEAIDAIKAEEALTMSQLDAYEDIVDKIVEEAWTECRTYLIGNEDGDGDFDDIHFGLSGDQACTPGTAEDLCDTYVRGPANEALLELEGCGDRQPMYSGPETISGQQQCNFDQELGATEDVNATACSDETAETTGAGIDSFGDIRNLIDCNSPASCEVDEDIVLAVQTNFGVFYDEGVVITLSTVCPAGAKITGLNNGEESYDLADELGIVNNDIITEVNGVKLDSNENVSDVLLWLSEGQDQVQLKRWRGTCAGGSSTTYNITVTTH